MKVFLIVQDDPFYLYDSMQEFLAKHTVIGAVVLGQKLPRDSWIQMLGRYINVFGYIGFLKLGLMVVWLKHFCGRDLQKVFQRNNIPLLSTVDVNSPHFIEQLKSLNPDLLVSVACPQKIKAEVLAIPNRGAINLHGGYLPDFPGVFTPFWNLLEGAMKAGCTVHWMNDQIDAGGILGRISFPISQAMTIMDIYKEISERGLPLLDDVIQQIANGTAQVIECDANVGKYHSFPSNQDGARFRSLGLKAI